MGKRILLQRTSLYYALICLVWGCGDDSTPLDGAVADTGPDSPTVDAATADAPAFDGGGDAFAQCFDGLEPGEGFLNFLDFETLDGAIRVKFARERGNGTPPSGETYPYDLVRFAIQRDGAVECITSDDALQYDYARHNWDDDITAMGRSTYLVHVEYSFNAEPPGWTDTLRIDGGDPIPLRLRACETLPSTDLNHCLWRAERVLAR